jgi:hypothetical protein
VVGLVAVAVVAVVAAGVTAVVVLVDRSGAPEVTATSDLVAGDCLRAPEPFEDVTRPDWRSGLGVPVVPCDREHGGEVLLVEDGWGPGEAYPGDERIVDAWVDRCIAAFDAYVGGPWEDSELDFHGWYPAGEAAWEVGDREVGCFAFEPGDDLGESVAGSGR